MPADSITILLVDDNPVDRKLIALALNKSPDLSFSVITASTLGEAREFTQAAITQLSTFPNSVERQGLIELAEFVTNRNL